MRAWLLAAALLALAGCASLPGPQANPVAGPAVAGLQQAWVQAVAGPAWAVRALTADASCPRLAWPGGSAAMTERSAPGDEAPPPGNKEPQRKPSHFALRACEAPWPALPAGVDSLQVDTVTLKAPAAEARRIVVIGDTGCRLKASGHAFQGCNDPLSWPFPRVLAQALAMQPDLVVHVGDYHYRESPCPAALAICADSPWGYGDDTWQADFFQPARALLAAAPWVFVRGNHEACSRAAQGWLRYLDPEAGPARACSPAGPGVNDGDFTEPFAVPLSPRSQLIVFDSSEIGSRTPPRDSQAWARWRAQLDRVAELSRNRAQSLFVTHHPSLAFSPSLLGTPSAARSGLTPLLQDATPGRLFPPGVQATLHGHIHMHQALGFAGNHPATLVIGNSGSAAAGRVDATAALNYELQPGALLETVEVHTDFGFSLLTATPEGWQLEAFDASGRPLASCTLAGSRLRC
ncbi:metallophosphoesterase family protein [Roseateles saccharophilus]|uniref:Calcineurin-like phosphoesterase family protein n=1 Tax=Roseateles saccharophilus TaxID=304 RepID=A0A4R3UWI9_ROSSA|nr:metallophosphoesterase [Roseateles saccharophilus]MDG0832676.1 metallophosphoesterase [Roseateles saccharophilus]TCU95390.1 calcineurin-like phosphoesterase family protein [Roseateles saccharophilus]